MQHPSVFTSDTLNSISFVYLPKVCFHYVSVNITHCTSKRKKNKMDKRSMGPGMGHYNFKEKKGIITTR